MQKLQNLKQLFQNVYGKTTRTLLTSYYAAPAKAEVAKAQYLMMQKQK